MKKRLKRFKKFFKKNTGQANQEVLDFIQNDYEQIIKRSRSFLQLDQEFQAKPVTISVPDTYFENEKIRIKNVNLGNGETRVVYDQALFSVLYFGKDRIYYYQANVDHRFGRVDYDVAGQIAYEKIAHVQHTISFDNPDNPIIQQLDIEVNLVDGSVIPFRVRNRYLSVEGESLDVLTEKEAKLLDILYRVS